MCVREKEAERDRERNIQTERDRERNIQTERDRERQIRKNVPSRDPTSAS